MERTDATGERDVRIDEENSHLETADEEGVERWRYVDPTAAFDIGPDGGSEEIVRGELTTPCSTSRRAID